jgi:5-methylcytosine-specific restriction endonuclease McrA
LWEGPGPVAEWQEERRALRLAEQQAREVAAQSRRAAQEAALALQKERSEARVAEQRAMAAANDRRKAELLAAREATRVKYAARLVQIEAERAERQRRREERERYHAERRRALTPAERKDRARRARKTKRSPWLRETGWRAELWLKQGGRCALTGVPLEGVVPHLDHIVPRAKGGSNAPDNQQWTHPAANRAKGEMTDEEFRTWLLAAADALRSQP